MRVLRLLVGSGKSPVHRSEFGQDSGCAGFFEKSTSEPDSLDTPPSACGPHLIWDVIQISILSMLKCRKTRVLNVGATALLYSTPQIQRSTQQHP